MKLSTEILSFSIPNARSKKGVTDRLTDNYPESYQSIESTYFFASLHSIYPSLKYASIHLNVIKSHFFAHIVFLFHSSKAFMHLTAVPKIPNMVNEVSCTNWVYIKLEIFFFYLFLNIPLIQCLLFNNIQGQLWKELM